MSSGVFEYRSHTPRFQQRRYGTIRNFTGNAQQALSEIQERFNLLNILDSMSREEAAWWRHNFATVVATVARLAGEPATDADHVYAWIEGWCAVTYTIAYEGIYVLHQRHVLSGDSVTVEEVQFWIDNLSPKIGELLHERADHAFGMWKFLVPKLDYEKCVRTRLIAYFQESIPLVASSGMEVARHTAIGFVGARITFDHTREGHDLGNVVKMLFDVSDTMSAVSREYWSSVYPETVTP